MGSTVEREQRELLNRIERLVRLIKTDLCYGGSKDTADLRGDVHERLFTSDELHRKFREEPGLLRGLVRTLVRNVLIDEIRRATAKKRRTPDGDQLRTEWLAQRGDVAAKRTPGLHRECERRQDVQRVMAALERFAHGEGAGRVRPERRRGMQTALRMHWEGYSHAQIAEQLGMPKSTVGHWIDALSLILARAVASDDRSRDNLGLAPTVADLDGVSGASGWGPAA